MMVKLHSFPESSLEYEEYGRLLDKPLKKENNYLNQNVICNISVGVFLSFYSTHLRNPARGAFLPTRINTPLQIFTMFPGLEAAFVVYSANKTTLGQHCVGLTTLL